MTRKNALYIIMYKRYLLDMLMRSSEEHIDLEVMTEAELACGREMAIRNISTLDEVEEYFEDEEELK